MDPRNLVFHVLLISIVHFSTTLSMLIYPQGLLILRLPELGRESLSVPDRWKVVHPAHPLYKAPQMEIHMTKGEVSPDENWIFTNEYKYSGNEYEPAISMTDDKQILEAVNENVETKEPEKEDNDGIQGNRTPPENFIPAIGSRNVITTPEHCNYGEQRDHRGQCRAGVGSS